MFRRWMGTIAATATVLMAGISASATSGPAALTGAEPAAAALPATGAGAGATPAATPTVMQAAPTVAATDSTGVSEVADPGGTSVHAPFAASECAACHASADGRQSAGLRGPARELCATCHPVAAARGRSHPVSEQVTCLSCHRPHRSDQRALLVRSGDGLCIGCHDLGS